MNIQKLLILLLTLILASPAFTRSSGPPDGYAGDPPARQTCVACHATYPLNSGPGFIRLDNMPVRYQPEQRYELQLTLWDPNAVRWGFELTALFGDYTTAGTLVITDALNTLRSQEREENPVYIKQSRTGNFSGQRNSVVWNFAWVAPPSGSGSVAFWFAGCAANGGGTNTGDRVYSSGFTTMPVLEDVSDELMENIPTQFVLGGVYPNPFNNRAMVSLSLPQTGYLSVLLFDVSGRMVQRLYDGQMHYGENTILLDGTGLPSGNYFVKLEYNKQGVIVPAVLGK